MTEGVEDSTSALASLLRVFFSTGKCRVSHLMARSDGESSFVGQCTEAVRANSHIHTAFLR